MDKLVYLLPVLGCAAMMGVMMLMMRGNDASHGAAPRSDAATHEEIAILRAEVATLRAVQTQPPVDVEHDAPATRSGTA